jgi:hypothetical protein
MIVGPVKKIADAILPGHYTEKAAHILLLCIRIQFDTPLIYTFSAVLQIFWQKKHLPFPGKYIPPEKKTDFPWKTPAFHCISHRTVLY